MIIGQPVAGFPPLGMVSGNVGSVVVAGGSRFPIKAAADEALGV